MPCAGRDERAGFWKKLWQPPAEPLGSWHGEEGHCGTVFFGRRLSMHKAFLASISLCSSPQLALGWWWFMKRKGCFYSLLDSSWSYCSVRGSGATLRGDSHHRMYLVSLHFNTEAVCTQDRTQHLKQSTLAAGSQKAIRRKLPALIVVNHWDSLSRGAL